MTSTTRMLRCFTLPSFPDARKNKSASILRVGMEAIMGSVLLSVIIGWERVQSVSLPFIAAYVASSVLGLWLLRCGYVRPAGFAYCSVLWIAIAVGDVVLAQPDASVVSSFLNVVLLAGFGLGEWAAMGFGLLAVVWVALMSWLRSIGALPDPVSLLHPIDVVLQSAMPLLCTAILAGYGFRSLQRALARAEASEEEQAALASRHRALAELGERIVRTESKPAFASQVIADLQRLTGATAVAVYVPGSDSYALERFATIGTESPLTVSRALPLRDSEEPPTHAVHLVPAHTVGIPAPGSIAWTGQPGHAVLALLVIRELPLPAHDEALLVGCVALLAAALSRLDAEEQLRQAQKVETVGQLTGVVAHDFNNLLTSIIGGSELVLDSVEDPELRDILRDVIRAGEHAALLTKRLMAFARRDVLEFRLVDLREFVCSSGTLLKRLMGAQIELSIPRPDGPVWIWADLSCVEQILLNLLLNARDATHGSGKVAIAIDSDCAAHTAVLRVSDNGVGMDDAVRARIFDPFFTTKPAGKGTGLGLSAVKSAADALGGVVEVSSTKDRGSEFRVILPLSEAEAVSDKLGDQPLASARAHERVLLVDDQDIVRRTLAAVLKRAGYEVFEARDGVDALDKIASGTAPSVVVSDISMPRMSGFELARALIDRRPRVPVVLLTGYAELEERGSALLAAELPVLKKPVTAESLTSAVRRALDASSDVQSDSKLEHARASA